MVVQLYTAMLAIIAVVRHSLTSVHKHDPHV